MLVQGYPLNFVEGLIDEYIYRLKGVVVHSKLRPTDNIENFEKMANLAINAYEGGWKIK